MVNESFGTILQSNTTLRFGPCVVIVPPAAVLHIDRVVRSQFQDLSELGFRDALLDLGRAVYLKCNF